MDDLDFNTFEDFLKKFPLDEITIPVCIEPPEGPNDYWLIQLALPMKNKVINCCVWEANSHKVTKYRNSASSTFKKAIGLSYSSEK